MNPIPKLIPAMFAAALAACAPTPSTQSSIAGSVAMPEITFADYRGKDDLLTGGLGLDGLRSPVPPTFERAEAPTAVELRRRALWSNFRGIADLRPEGGYGVRYG